MSNLIRILMPLLSEAFEQAAVGLVFEYASLAPLRQRFASLFTVRIARAFLLRPANNLGVSHYVIDCYDVIAKVGTSNQC